MQDTSPLHQSAARSTCAAQHVLLHTQQPIRGEHRDHVTRSPPITAHALLNTPQPDHISLISPGPMQRYTTIITHNTLLQCGGGLGDFPSYIPATHPHNI